MAVLRIPFEMQGNCKFDSQEVKNVPSSWLGQAQQHKYVKRTAGEILDIDFLVAWWPLSVPLCCQNVISCYMKSGEVFGRTGDHLLIQDLEVYWLCEQLIETIQFIDQNGQISCRPHFQMARRWQKGLAYNYL